jgi:hypothetical protein
MMKIHQGETYLQQDERSGGIHILLADADAAGCMRRPA